MMKYVIFVIILFVLQFSSLSGSSDIDNKLEILYKRTEIFLKNRNVVPTVYSINSNNTGYEASSNPLWFHGERVNLKIIGTPCACFTLQCGCCAVVNIPLLGLNQQSCVNLTYDPFLFALIIDVSWNNSSLVHNVLSAKNPPAICIPLPTQVIPLVQIDFCIRLFDIYTPEVRNIHLCMDWDIRMYNASILILHFDCLRYGLDGAAILKPGDNGNLNFGIPPVFPLSLIKETTTDSNIIYDEVTEVKKDTNYNNSRVEIQNIHKIGYSNNKYNFDEILE